MIWCAGMACSAAALRAANSGSWARVKVTDVPSAPVPATVNWMKPELRVLAGHQRTPVTWARAMRCCPPSARPPRW